jgi:hypothetical protein
MSCSQADGDHTAATGVWKGRPANVVNCGSRSSRQEVVDLFYGMIGDVFDDVGKPCLRLGADS